MLLFSRVITCTDKNAILQQSAKYVQSFIYPPVLPAGRKRKWKSILSRQYCVTSAHVRNHSPPYGSLYCGASACWISLQYLIWDFSHYRLCDHKTEAVSRKGRKTDAAQLIRWCWSIASNSNKIDPLGKLHWSEKRCLKLMSGHWAMVTRCTNVSF